MREEKLDKQGKLEAVSKDLDKKRRDLKNTVLKLLSIKGLIARNESSERLNTVKFPFLMIVPDPSRDTIVEYEAANADSRCSRIGPNYACKATESFLYMVIQMSSSLCSSSRK